MSDEIPRFEPDPNPTLQSETTAIKALLDKLKAAETNAAYFTTIFNIRIGFHYRRIIDGQLWKQGPFKDGKHWAKKEYGKGATLMGDAAALSRAFEEAIAAQYQFDALAGFLTWANSTGLSPLPKDPGPTLIRVPAKNGTFITKPFSDCSATDMKKAVASLKGPKAKAALPPEAAERFGRCKAAVAGIQVDGKPFPFKVVIKKGEAKFGIDPVPFDDLAKAILALAEARAAVPLAPPPPGITSEELQKLKDAASKIDLSGLDQMKKDMEAAAKG
jgi:hypothetical protein